MTIDLKWGLPLYFPVAFVLIGRLTAFLAGVSPDYDVVETFWMLSLSVGLAIGCAAFLIMAQEGVKWNVTIGGRGK